MANLQLAVKGEYFDAMIRGEKTEEYRLCIDYWNKRLVNRKYYRLIITKGYPKREDFSRRIDVPYNGYEIKKSHRLTLDEACSLLNDIQTYRNNTNSINGDSKWKKKSSLVKRQHRI